MTTLARELRKELEKTVKQARRVAEAGARKVVEQLAVQHHEPWGSMTPQQRALRTRLRAHGRQLGDRRDEKRGTQAIGRLVQECAYEHWHRMLFARFLAETDLLIEPESGVAITLDEVQELAREKSTDWLELASDYAERMLPQIFRKGDPVLDVALPPETRSQLEDLLKALPREVFLADDSLGWVYQFWQADRKDEVNRSEKKIGADELPAVTQLFTEDYMVLFLLHNTLGAWWAGRVLATRPELAKSAKSEDELRAACKVGDIEWIYLRFVREPSPAPSPRGGEEGEAQVESGQGALGPWRPAAGTFDGWPRAAKDITVLDPCMGSGHFLVFALPILVAFRMAEEGLSRKVAVEAVLRDNLFGLEIDPRCTQIAAFNLAFAAWRMVGHRPLPRLNLACSGLAIGVTKAEWLKLAEKAAAAADPAAKRDILGLEKNLITSGISQRVKSGLERLYDLFARAPWLGSLIDPRAGEAPLAEATFGELESLLSPILTAASGDDIAEMAVAAQGIAKAGELLGRQFVLVATNVPYLARQRQHQLTREYAERQFPEAKNELGVSMFERMFAAARPGGAVAIVSLQTWRFLGLYERFRRHLLKIRSLNLIGQLGSGAFETISGEVVNVALAICRNNPPAGKYLIHGLDVMGQIGPIEKATGLLHTAVKSVKHSKILADRIARISFSESDDSPQTLQRFADTQQGVTTGDLHRYGRQFWEVVDFHDWDWWQGTVDETQLYGGRSRVLWWQRGLGPLVTESTATLRGQKNWGRPGVHLRMVGDLPVTISTGEKTDDVSTIIIPRQASDLPALWCFAECGEMARSIRAEYFSLKLAPTTPLLVPCDIAHWRRVAEEKYPNGLPQPDSIDPRQWLFPGHPKGATHQLQVAVARLVGYYWPRLAGSSFPSCPAVGPDGLEKHADADGIVCLTALKGEPPAEQRLNAFLADAFGAEWSAARLASLLAVVGFAGKTLDDWLRDGFFAQHCELFHQRPFIWHIWDGRRDGFQALVNHHRLAAPGGEGQRTLEKLIYSYLGDWIDRQRANQKAGVEGADGRLAAAEHLRAELTKILEGETPYDIFVRWKPLHEQPIGWEPDINDGVRMNIRPFTTARPLGARSANACVLRTTPKIKWDKDRGKEPPREKHDYPWFWDWDETTQDFPGRKDFDGNRWNDLHYSRAYKRATRGRKRS